MARHEGKFHKPEVLYRISLMRSFRKQGPIVVIGTDCPQLNQKDIAQHLRL